MFPFSAASCEQLYFMPQYVSNQGVLAAVAGCGGGGFAADFHPPAFLGFLNVPFQRDPSSLSHRIYLFFLFTAPTLLDYHVWQNIAAGTVLRLGQAGSLPGGGADGLWRQRSWCVRELEWKVNVLLFFPQAPQGCDPADSYSPSAELLLALCVVLLALGKLLRFSSLLYVVLVFPCLQS